MFRLLQHISIRLANTLIYIILSLMIIFHLLVLVGVIPWNMVWGGRMESQEQAIAFELSSLVVVVLIIGLVYLNTRELTKGFRLFVKIFIWLCCVYFFLITVGNILAENTLEQYVFSPLAFLLGILFLRLGLEKHES